MSRLARGGWCVFGPDPDLRRWADAVAPVAARAIADPRNRADWLRCEGTWFVGVDCLPNGPDGAVEGSGPLRGKAIDAVIREVGALPPLHRGQVSAITPGYPKPREGESDAAFRYRLNRDGAHVDGLLLEGPDRRRILRETHAWILGLPLTPPVPGASPLVVWEGSPAIMQRAFRAVFERTPRNGWEGLDLTDAYHAARREVFATCPRREILAGPGEAILLHRHGLHGIAPWRAQSTDEAAARVIVYFRPECPGGSAEWIRF